MPVSYLFPGGRRKALTLSYDDGVHQDYKLVEIMNKYGVKGTFHLNGGLLGEQGRVSADEITNLYSGHEISAHGLTHQSLTVCPREKIIDEIIGDREVLERLTGRIIRGMSYAYGSVNDFVVEMLKCMGIEYARMVQTTGDFHIPDDFLRWRGTCHHNERLLDHTKRFIECEYKWQPQLFYIWGHSYEFDNDGNWDMFEEFCKAISSREDIWYATNIEIYDYIRSFKALRFSADLKRVLNISATEVILDIDGDIIKIPAGTEMVI